MKFCNKLIPIAVAVLLAGCATNTNQIESTEDKYRQFGNMVWHETETTSFDDSIIPKNYSRLVFIRSQEIENMQSNAYISIDDTFQIGLQDSNYSTIYVDAGDHQININQTELKTNNVSDDTKTYTSKVGQTQYFFVDLDEENTPHLREITEQSALTVLQNARYSKQPQQVNPILAVKSQKAIQESDPVVKVEANKPINVQANVENATLNTATDTNIDSNIVEKPQLADTPTDASIAMERLAEAGDVFTQYNLGLMYYYGDGAHTDINKSVKWLTRAAEQGYANAQYHLGVMYNNYVKAPNLDYNQAMYWYKKAAAQNHADAQNNIGILYQNGQGVEQDLTIAKQWYTKSCENGFAEGCQNQQMLTQSGY